MLVYVFLVTTVVVCIGFVIKWLKSTSKVKPKIPGLDPRSKEDGNFEDIRDAGSFHEFLADLHKRLGPIASFWYGSCNVISIADARFFKDHVHVFDRPPVLFTLFEPLFGPKSLQYANGEDGQARRTLYDRCLNQVAIRKYFVIFQKIADAIITKLDGLPVTEHVSITEHMFEYALKTDLEALFGEHMDEAVVHRFKTVYDVAWGEMETRLKEPPTPERETTFQKARQELVTICKEMVRSRKRIPTEHADEYILDLILDLTADEERQFSDTIIYVVAGFHTTGNWLTWVFYFLASNPDIQERVYEEIRQILGDDDVDHTTMDDLQYLRQVLDETLRCSVLAPYAARFEHVDSEICGYTVLKETPVIHALGVASMDENTWPSAHAFDPDRFSPENVSKRPHLAFVPFGFAGKRVCPGQKFAYAEATVAMVTMLRKFKVDIVEGQKIERVHGLVTHPSEEIWVTMTKRETR